VETLPPQAARTFRVTGRENILGLRKCIVT